MKRRTTIAQPKLILVQSIFYAVLREYIFFKEIDEKRVSQGGPEVDTVSVLDKYAEDGNLGRAKRDEVYRRSVSGGDSCGVPPVPIPNTVVKPTYAESTWLETAWEDR